MIEWIKKLDKIRVVLVILALAFGANFSFNIYNRYVPAKSKVKNSESLSIVCISKICYDLPSGVTECVEIPNVFYNIIYYPDNKASTIYLKVK